MFHSIGSIMEQHIKLIKDMNESVKENFGQCSEHTHKIIDKLEKLEQIMTNRGYKFKPYHN